jgi:hypothetical protein
MESSVPADFETSERDLDQTLRAILTRSTVKIFRAHNRREDFSYSQFAVFDPAGHLAVKSLALVGEFALDETAYRETFRQDRPHDDGRRTRV